MVNILRVPDYIEAETEEQKISSHVEVSFVRTSYGMQVHCFSPKERVRTIILRWNGATPVETRILGDTWEWVEGHQEWKGMSGSRSYPWYFMTSVGGHYAGYGVMVQAKSMCCWEADTKGITLYMDVRCGGTGAELGGRWLHGATLVYEEYEEQSAFEAAAAFCEKMCANPLVPDAPVYGSISRHHIYRRNSEKELLEEADFLAGLSEGIKNRPFMVVNEGWQSRYIPETYNGGPWRAGNEGFPDMSRLAREIYKRKLRPGIWFRPLLNETEELPRETRLYNGCLDPSHPEVLRLIGEDLTTICEWGFSLIRHDFSSYDIFGKGGHSMRPFPGANGWSFYDKTKTSAEIMVNFYRMIRETTAPYQAMIEGCNTIGHLSAGLMHIQCVGEDTGRPAWDKSRRMGVNSLAFRLAKHRRFFDIAAGCIGITGQIPWEKKRLFAHLAAYGGAALFLSAEPGTLTAEERQEVHALFAAASESGKTCAPLDWEYTDCPEEWLINGEKVHYNWYGENGHMFPREP